MCCCIPERFTKGKPCLALSILVILSIYCLTFIVISIILSKFNEEPCPNLCSTQEFPCCFHYQLDTHKIISECPCGGMKYKYLITENVIVIAAVSAPFVLIIYLSSLTMYYCLYKKKVMRKEISDEARKEASVKDDEESH